MTSRPHTHDTPFDVSDERTVVTCPYCERPFASVHQRDLHRGEVHDDAIDEGERSAYDAAIDEERDQLWMYHFKAVVVLLVIYMLTGLAYLIVLSG